ncbi:MAG: hypothetical protein J1E16_05875 [Muribaculaceae bacterium]|nr:hypothetical protein [Muribaculaceae bacterium]
MKTDEKKKGTEKWNERHFQICLALISRPNVDCYGVTKPLSFQDIIAKADRMVALLQQREERMGGAV